MKQGLSILTFNWHEPFIYNLARTGQSFDVAEPSVSRAGLRKWDLRCRPVPSNCAIIGMQTAVEKLERKAYSAVVCHNPADVAAVAAFDVPVVLVFHNRLSTELALGGDTVASGDYLGGVKPLIERADIKVFVSVSKKEDWGMDGEVIGPGVDVTLRSPYTGNILKVLLVGNLIKERGVMLGHDLRMKAVEEFEYSIAGNNPSIPGSAPARNYDELLGMYASHRVYFHATIHPYEDGHNMAMLEAMAAGAPVVACAHPQSPVEDGVNGYISGDIGTLKEDIRALMGDLPLAIKLGRAGRETAVQAFPMGKFTSSWNTVLERAAKLKGAEA